MSLPVSAAGPRIDLTPSRLLRRGFLLMYGVTLLCLLVLPWPWWQALTAAAVAAVTGLLHGRHLRANAVVRLIHEPDDRWTLVTAGAARTGYRLLPDTWVHLRLTILNFAGPDRRSVVLLPDRLDPTAFRRLRVLLTLRGAGGSAGGRQDGRDGRPTVVG